jgi:hypothetical protein
MMHASLSSVQDSPDTVDAWKAAGLPIVDGDLTQVRRSVAATD